VSLSSKALSTCASKHAVHRDPRHCGSPASGGRVRTCSGLTRVEDFTSVRVTPYPRVSITSAITAGPGPKCGLIHHRRRTRADQREVAAIAARIPRSRKPTVPGCASARPIDRAAIEEHERIPANLLRAVDAPQTTAASGTAGPERNRDLVSQAMTDSKPRACARNTCTASPSCLTSAFHVPSSRLIADGALPLVCAPVDDSTIRTRACF